MKNANCKLQNDGFWQITCNHFMHRAITLILGFVTVFALTGADWTQFRGADTSSVSPDRNVPTSIGENIAWTAELPGRGLSDRSSWQGASF